MFLDGRDFGLTCIVDARRSNKVEDDLATVLFFDVAGACTGRVSWYSDFIFILDVAGVSIAFNRASRKAALSVGRSKALSGV